tara:strand:- start:1725 stop:1880 length:156 start_codon:yes stop_codon:yes gene_type:complete
MIKNILELLKYANGETENIRFAQGAKKLTTNFKDIKNKFKKEIKWELQSKK